MLSKEALKIYKDMQNKYIKDGYSYSGCICGDELNEISINIIKELEQVKLIQIRKCTGLAIELTKEERKKLLKKYNLYLIWLKRYPEFKINIVKEKLDIA